MNLATERRLLQIAILVGCLSPFGFGLEGILRGPAMLAGMNGIGVPADLVSHYRYLSGLFFGIGLIFLSCVPDIERRTTRFRFAAGAVVCGGLARLLGILMGDRPTIAHYIALGAELGLTPLLVLWQSRILHRTSA